jgi:hypothetical protein
LRMQPLFSFFILDFRVDFAEFKSILLICYYFTYNLLFLDLFVLFEIIYEFFFLISPIWFSYISNLDPTILIDICFT